MSTAALLSDAASQADAAAGTLHGKVVIVTGGARGLGAATAALLAESHARVVIADLSAEGAERHASALCERGLDAVAFALDVGDDVQARQVVAQTRERFGRIDALINNAGIDVTLPIDQLLPVDWERVLKTNLTGPFLMTKHAVAAMEPGGHVVNIASTASKRAWPNAAAYHATNWGLLGLSHALHAELRPRGIKVSAVVAGGMRTPFALERFPEMDPAALQDPAAVAKAVRFVLTQPAETVVPEIMVLPMREASWP